MQPGLGLGGPWGLELLLEGWTCGGHDAMRFEPGTERRRESTPTRPVGQIRQGAPGTVAGAAGPSRAGPWHWGR